MLNNSTNPLLPLNVGITEPIFVGLQMGLSFSQIIADVMNIVKISSNMTFQYALVETPNIEILENGEEVGALAMLKKQEIDIYALPLPLNQEHFEVVEYLRSFYFYSNTYFFSKKRNATKINDVLDAFRQTHYEVCLLMTLLFGIYCGIVYWVRHVILFPSERVLKLPRALYAFLAQIIGDFSQSPKGTYLRIFSIMFTSLVFLLAIAFNLELTTSLVVQDDAGNINSVKDVLRIRNAKFCYFNDAFFDIILQARATDDISKLYDLKLKTVREDPNIFDISKVCGGERFVKTIHERDVISFDLEEMMAFCAGIYCDQVPIKLYKSSQPFIQVLTAPLIRRSLDKEVREVIHVSISRLSDIGFTHYWQRFLKMEIDKCFIDGARSYLDEDIAEFSGLNIHVFTLSFEIWGVGLILSGATFLLEKTVPIINAMSKDRTSRFSRLSRVIIDGVQ